MILILLLINVQLLYFQVNERNNINNDNIRKSFRKYVSNIPRKHEANELQ